MTARPLQAACRRPSALAPRADQRRAGHLGRLVEAHQVEERRRHVGEPSVGQGHAVDADERGGHRVEGVGGVGLAGLGIVLLLLVVTGSLTNLALVLVNLPFAFVGGVLAVAASGAVISLGSIVGFVTLFGISLRNTIMMIAHYEHMVLVEGRAWNEGAAIEGAADRLVPILMTSLVTGLGLLPLALGAGEPGREIEGPMALVILGGLATSTVLNLAVLPMLALRFARFKAADTAL